MTIRLLIPMLASAIAAGTFTGCQPEERCGGELVFVYGSCRPCPDDGYFDPDTGTCACNEPDYYEYAPHSCRLMEGVEPPMEEDPDEGEPVEASEACVAYCDFVDGCVAQNALAAGVAGDVIAGLDVDGDDLSSCEASCTTDTAADEDDPVAACINDGRMDAACDDNDEFDGVGAALGLIGDCCKANEGSELCASICAAIEVNGVVAGMVDFCD